MTSNTTAVDRQLVPDPAAFRPFAYDVFTPEIVRQRDSTSSGGNTADRMETMRDTFSKVMAFLKNTGQYFCQCSIALTVYVMSLCNRSVLWFSVGQATG
jgi:hypothetical protein